MARALTAEEKKWQAENDAHTLADASVIKKDKTRLKNAVVAAKRMSTEQNVRLSALRSVSSLKPSPKKKK